MKQINDFSVQNYVVTPAPLAAGQTAPQTISDQKWQLVLTGVAIVDVPCTSASNWSVETLHINPNMRTPIQYLINQFGIPIPTDPPYRIDSFQNPPVVLPIFNVEQYTIHAAPCSVFDKNTAVNMGFSVNDWRIAPLKTYTDVRTGGNAPTLKRVFDGFLVDVAVRDTDAILYRVSFQLTLLGKIFFGLTQGDHH